MAYECVALFRELLSRGLAAINRALNLIPKRAESRQAERLRDTFVDSGVAAALEAIDHQVLHGRRGTGKTHALRYLETTVGARGGIAGPAATDDKPPGNHEDHGRSRESAPSG